MLLQRFLVASAQVCIISPLHQQRLFPQLASETRLLEESLDPGTRPISQAMQASYLLELALLRCHLRLLTALVQPCSLPLQS